MAKRSTTTAPSNDPGRYFSHLIFAYRSGWPSRDTKRLLEEWDAERQYHEAQQNMVDRFMRHNSNESLGPVN